MSAELLQRCLDRIASGERAEVVFESVGADAALRGLVELALAAEMLLPTPAPGAMRASQQAALQDMLAAQHPAQGSDVRTASGMLVGVWRRWAVRGVAIALSLSLALGSAVAVSADSLPGDALYGVKLAAESARVVITVGPEARALLRAGMAAERLAELRALVDRGVMPKPADIDRLVAAHRALLRDAPGGSLSSLAAVEAAESARALRDLADDVGALDPATAVRLAAAADAVEGSVPSAQEDDGGAPGGAPDAPSQRGGVAGEAPEDEPGGTEPDPAPAEATEFSDTSAPDAATFTASPATVAATRTATGVATFTPLPSPVASSTRVGPGSPGGPVATRAPATSAPPTSAPPTPPPPTSAPTSVPPTAVPATQVPPTQVPPTGLPPNPIATERSLTATHESP